MGQAPPQAPRETPPLIFGSQVPNSVTSAFSNACRIRSLTATCCRRPHLPQPLPSRPQPPLPAAFFPAPHPHRVTPPAGTAFRVRRHCEQGPGPCSRPSGLARRPPLPSPASSPRLRVTCTVSPGPLLPQREVRLICGPAAVPPGPPCGALGHTHSVSFREGPGVHPTPSS